MLCFFCRGVLVSGVVEGSWRSICLVCLYVVSDVGFWFVIGLGMLV